MAKNKPNKKNLGPAKWFLDIGRESARARIKSGTLSKSAERAYILNARAREKDYLIRTAKILREYFEGFDASDGYDLRHPERWTLRMVNELRRYGGHLNSLLATPSVRVPVPKSKTKRKALESFTGQVYKKGTKQPRAFVIQVDSEAATKDTKVEVTKDGQVKITRQIGNTKLVEQFYLFVDYGFNPNRFNSFDDVVEAAKHLVKNVLPDGYYTLWSAQHGTIWVPMKKEEIILNLTKNIGESGGRDGFPNDLLGFKFQGDEFAAEDEFIARSQRRRARDRKKAELRKEMHERVRAGRRA